MMPALAYQLIDSKADPTGTASIRKSWRSAAKLRMRLARAGIRQVVMEQDMLGISQLSPLAMHGRDVRLGAFHHVIAHIVDRQLLGDWAKPFVRQAWARGVTDAHGPASVGAAAVEVLLDHELAGISAAVTTAVARVGARHFPSRAQAWQMVATIYDKEMTKRLPALIDTLTVKSYNNAKIESYRTRGVQYVGVIPEAVPRSHVNDAWEQTESGNWVFKRSKRAKGRLEAEFEGELVATQTAGDDRVCDDCDDIASDAPYELDEAMDLLPAHIGCRCAIVEWTGTEATDYEPSFYILPVQDADFNEEDHPRGEHGKWVEKGGEEKEEKKKTLAFKPSKDAAEALKRINNTLGKVAGHSVGYRWTVGERIKEAQKFGLPGHTVDALYKKIGESFARQAKALYDKGKNAEGDAALHKANIHGFKGEELQQFMKTAPPPKLKAKAEEPAAELPKPSVAKSAAESSKVGAGEIAGWTKTGPQLGSNPGGTYQLANGDKYYVKFPATDKHAQNELLANELYKMAGIDVPEQHALVDMVGKTGVASKWVQGTVLNKLSGTDETALKPQIQAGFAVDAWLGNRDVIGLENDNIIRSPGGVAVRLDQGGAMLFRAQGETKEFGPTVGEFDSLRDPSMNAQSAAIFGDMTKGQLVKSIGLVTKIPDDQILAKAKAYGLEDVGHILIQRKAYLAAKAETLAGAVEPPAAPTPLHLTYTQAMEGGEMAVKSHMATLPPFQELTPTQVTFHALKLEGMMHPEAVQALKSTYGSIGGAMMQLTPAKPAGVTALSSAETMVSEYLAEHPHASSGSVASVLTVPQKEALLAKHGTIMGAMIELEPKPAMVTAPPGAKPFDPESKEAKLAAKGTPIPSHSLQSPEAKEAVATFNKMYEGKTLTDPTELQGKIAYYGALMKEVQKAEQLHAAKWAETAAATLKQQQSEADKQLLEQWGKGDANAAKNLAALRGIGAPNYLIQDAASSIKQHGFNMSPLEGALVKAYTSHYYDVLNEQMRHGSITPEQFQFAQTLNRALDKLPPEVGTFYRGVSGLPKEELAKMKPGYVVWQRAFTSSSRNPRGGTYKYTIKGHSGRNVEPLSEHPGEAEILFKHNTPFLITKVEGNTFHMEEVD